MDRHASEQMTWVNNGHRLLVNCEQVEIDGKKPGVIPTYGSAGAACFDIYVLPYFQFSKNRKRFMLHTGLKFEVPEGYVMKLYERSSTALNYGINLSNITPIIDSDFRGELMLIFNAADIDDNPYSTSVGFVITSLVNIWGAPEGLDKDRTVYEICDWLIHGKHVPGGVHSLELLYKELGFNVELKPIRIAQGEIMEYIPVSFNVVDKLSETARGTGGMGSTGVN